MVRGAYGLERPSQAEYRAMNYRLRQIKDEPQPVGPSAPQQCVEASRPGCHRQGTDAPVGRVSLSSSTRVEHVHRRARYAQALEELMNAAPLQRLNDAAKVRCSSRMLALTILRRAQGGLEEPRQGAP